MDSGLAAEAYDQKISTTIGVNSTSRLTLSLLRHPVPVP